MKDFWQKAKPIGLSLICVLMALYFSPLTMTVSFAISTHDVAPIWLIFFHPTFAWLASLPGLLILIAAPACFVLSWKVKQLRLYRVPAFLVLLTSWGMFCGHRSFGNGWAQRRAGLTKASVRAIPLLVAIENYHFDNGESPAALTDLVPQYIAAIPETGMTAYPQFYYHSEGKGPEDATFHSYELSVRTPFGLSFDKFYYWPKNNYSKLSSSGQIERVGKWAYVHE